MTAASRDSACVLVIDDEEDVRETLRDVVEMEGCSAVLAASALEGMKILERHKPCLIILDLMMPGMNGAEMLTLLRHDENLSGLPVLMSTSAPSRAPAGVALLPKPIDLETLCRWIRTNCDCAAA
jgi:CheY-like chemotaxis protein